VEAFNKIYEKDFANIDNQIETTNSNITNTHESIKKAEYIKKALEEECGENKIYLQTDISRLLSQYTKTESMLLHKKMKLEKAKEYHSTQDIDDIYFFMVAYYPPDIKETQIFE